MLGTVFCGDARVGAKDKDKGGSSIKKQKHANFGRGYCCMWRTLSIHYVVAKDRWSSLFFCMNAEFRLGFGKKKSVCTPQVQ